MEGEGGKDAEGVMDGRIIKERGEEMIDIKEEYSKQILRNKLINMKVIAINQVNKGQTGGRRRQRKGRRGRKEQILDTLRGGIPKQMREKVERRLLNEQMREIQ